MEILPSHSKKIADYFPIPFTHLRPQERLAFDIFLYFEGNEHILLWRRRDELMSIPFLKKYQDRHLSRVWIHQRDQAQYEAYLTPPLSQERSLPELAQEITQRINEPKSPSTKTDSAARATRIANLAEEMLRKSVAPAELRTQLKINEKVREAVAAILRNTLGQSPDPASRKIFDQITEIWKLAALDPTLEHGVDVATLAVLFAMAFKRIEPAILGDIALAGLIHDIGVTQIPSDLTCTPFQSLSAEKADIYEMHVAASLALLPEMEANLPERISILISGHHERFDGTGFPRGLRGSKIADLCTLLGMADEVANFATGHIDGNRRTLSEAFRLVLETFQNGQTPRYNPDVFLAVTGWLREKSSDDPGLGAADLVTRQSELIQRGA